MGPLTTTGLVMPDDFPRDPYEAVHQSVRDKRSANEFSWDQYAGAWNAISYRFLALDASDAAFTESIHKSGTAPPSPDRYIQESQLFSFFLNGLATLESFFYGMFAIGSILEPSKFKMSTADELRAINPWTVSQAFAAVYPDEHLTKELASIVSVKEFASWREIRNILAHRAAPGRDISGSVGSQQPDIETYWKIGIKLDTSTTHERRIWLSSQLSSLLMAAAEFVQTHVA